MKIMNSFKISFQNPNYTLKKNWIEFFVKLAQVLTKDQGLLFIKYKGFNFQLGLGLADYLQLVQPARESFK